MSGIFVPEPCECAVPKTGVQGILDIENQRDQERSTLMRTQGAPAHGLMKPTTKKGVRRSFLRTVAHGVGHRRGSSSSETDAQHHRFLRTFQEKGTKEEGCVAKCLRLDKKIREREGRESLALGVGIEKGDRAHAARPKRDAPLQALQGTHTEITATEIPVLMLPRVWRFGFIQLCWSDEAFDGGSQTIDQEWLCHAVGSAELIRSGF